MSQALAQGERMEEMQYSWSWRQTTVCMCTCLKIVSFGPPASKPPSVVFWSSKCENGRLQKDDSSNLRYTMHLLFYHLNVYLEYKQVSYCHITVFNLNTSLNSSPTWVLTVSFSVSCPNLMVHTWWNLSCWTHMSILSTRHHISKTVLNNHLRGSIWLLRYFSLDWSVGLIKIAWRKRCCGECGNISPFSDLINTVSGSPSVGTQSVVVSEGSLT